MTSLDKVELHVFDNNRFVDIFKPGVLSKQGVDTIKECIIMNDQLKVIKALSDKFIKADEFNKMDGHSFPLLDKKMNIPVDEVLTDRERFTDITKEMVELFDRKNTDYGNSFEKSLDDDGLLVSKIRLGDKFNRFSQLIGSDNLVKDESIRDTLIDLANYTVMTLMYLDKNE